MYFVSKFNLDRKDGDHRECNKFKVSIATSSLLPMLIGSRRCIQYSVTVVGPDLE